MVYSDGPTGYGRDVLLRIRRKLHWQFMHRVPRPIKRLAFWGERHGCPVCGSHLRRFLTFYGRANVRRLAQCPVCGALERHRLLWLLFQRESDIFDGKPKKMLHVAPEVDIASRLSGLPGLDYVTADFQAGRAMVQMDITDIHYPDASFDVICCSHVLEHVPDDRRAMRELARVLAPHGWAALLVPISAERTLEDPSITDPRERERLFGQDDHVRRYGPDFEDRLKEAGFAVRVFTTDFVGEPERRKYGLRPEDRVFLCRRAAP